MNLTFRDFTTEPLLGLDYRPTKHTWQRSIHEKTYSGEWVWDVGYLRELNDEFNYINNMTFEVTWEEEELIMVRSFT